jgi:peroxin-2
MKYFKIWYLLLIFQELFVFAVPLINYHALKRRITNLFSSQRKVAGNRGAVFTGDSKCAECSEKLVLPHHMGCGHIFCFYCIKVRKYFSFIFSLLQHAS